MKNLLTLVLLSLVIAFTSCDKDQVESITAPETYEFLRDGESTVSFSGQTTRIAMGAELVNALVDLDQTADNLIEMYANQSSDGGDVSPYSDESLNSSTKSIKSKVAASADFVAVNGSVVSSTLKNEIENWILSQVLEVNANANQLASPGVAGQVADGSTPRYVSAKGLEYNQAVSKSLIGALMVDQISNHYLSPTVLDAGTQVEDNESGITVEGKSYTTMEHKWDEAYGYLFGASANPTEPLLTLGDDNFLNKYLARVEADEDFSGIAQEIFVAFKLGRAAIVGQDYELRDIQAEVINEALAKVIAIRAIYYLQSGKDALANNDIGGAFHDLSEGYGFIYSLRFIRQAGTHHAYFTTDEVDGFIDQLMIGNGFWDVSAETLDALSETVASAFDFTVDQAYK